MKLSYNKITENATSEKESSRMKAIAAHFPKLPPERRRELLTLPRNGTADAVLDTDTFNEIDDQFALAFAVLSPEVLNLKAVLAAPFHNARSSGPADGMEKSYEEILKILKLLDKPADDFVFHGSRSYLKDALTPVESDAAHRIIALAREAKARGRVLYILAIAAITNVASALLMAPDIIDSVVVVWLGGHAFHTVPNTEFNLHQDIPASQVMFESGVPLVLLPCCGVVELLMTTLPDLKRRCGRCGELGEFLYQRTYDYLHGDPCIQKVIWDIATVACFVAPDAVCTELISAPILNDDSSWTTTGNRHEIRLATYLKRGEVFDALFRKLETSVKP